MIGRSFNRMACLVIAGLGLLLYAHALPFPFAFDDHVYLVDNPLVKDLASFTYWRDVSSFATLSQRMGLDPDLSTNLILRPVSYFTFFLNYAFGGMRPAGFRAVNIGIHCANAVLLFLLLRALLLGSRKRASIPVSSARFIPFASALLFVSHPLQTESVTYIVQRFTSLGVLFYLLALWTHVLTRLSWDARRVRGFRVVSIAALILGMLSKEFVFCAPFMMVAIDYLVLGTPFKRACRAALPHFLCLPLIPILMILTAMAQQDGQFSLSAAMNVANSRDRAQGPYDYALTQCRVVLAYLRLILLPVGLNLDRDYPLSRSLGEGRVLGALTAIVAMNVGAWFWYRMKPADVRRSLLWCSVMGYFLTLLPDSSVVPLPDLMADHRSYLPSLGALTALVCLIDGWRVHLARGGVTGVYIRAAMAAWVLALSVATCMRNAVWRSELTLWRDTVMKSPDKFRPWANLGVAYYEHHETQKAIACLCKALQLEPGFIPGYVNLAAIQNAKGLYRDTLETSARGLAHAPRHGGLYFHRGWAYCQLGETNQSLQCLALATNAPGANVRPYVALAAIHAELGQDEAALAACRRATLIQPDDASLRDAVLRLEARIRESRKGRLDAPSGDAGRHPVLNAARPGRLPVTSGP